MSAAKAQPFNPAALPRRPADGRRRLDRAFVVFCMGTALLSVVVLAALIISILAKGLTLLGWRFLTSIPNADPLLAGIWPALGGTVWVCAVCALFTLPIGVATAIFLEEFRPRHRLMQQFHSIVQLNISNLSGVPSVVYGIIGLTAFVGMFGLLGQPKKPAFQVGVQWVDQFGAANSDGINTVVIPVANQNAPPVALSPGIEGTTRYGEQPINLIGPFDVAPANAQQRAAAIRLGSTPTRIQVGARHFDEFTSFAGAKVRVEVAAASSPPTVVKPPLKAYIEGDNADLPYIRVLASDQIPSVIIQAETVPERVEADGKFFDQFTTEDNQILRIPVAGRDAPPIVLRDGDEIVGQTESGRAVTLIGNDSPLPGALDSGFGLMLRAAPTPSRISRPSWYYLRLPFGRSVLAGGLTLMLVILPIVIIASQESLRAVPNSLREGAQGMGATPWQVVWNVTLPASIPGIMTGSILAMSRAIGEAAPILIICGIVFIGYAPGNLMDNFTVMPLQIYDWAGQPDPKFQYVAASGIIVLLSVLLTFNGIAVFIRQRLQKPLS